MIVVFFFLKKKKSKVVFFFILCLGRKKMSSQEFNEFLSNLFNAIYDFEKIDYDIVSVSCKKIMIMLFAGREWDDDELKLLKDATIQAANDMKDEFLKFGYEPIPIVKFREAQCCAVVKWRAKEN